MSCSLAFDTFATVAHDETNEPSFTLSNNP